MELIVLDRWLTEMEEGQEARASSRVRAYGAGAAGQ